MTLAWRLALRDLRGGLGALRLLAVCLFLGVAAIAGVGSLSSAIVAQMASQGREILGGDVEVTLSQREATPDERAAITSLGRVSETAEARAMAVRADGADSVLVQLKAVDHAYPLYGRLGVMPGGSAMGPGRVLVAPALVDRLHLRVGQPLRIGEATLFIAGIIASEPDKMGNGGFNLGPTVLMDMRTLASTALIQPGSLYTWSYRVALAPGSDAAGVAYRLGKTHADGGWRVRDASNAAPSTRRFIEQIGQFLTLVGLAALLIAGIGVGNGVGAYLDGKRAGIATLKTLGASSRLIFRIYLIEIGLVTVASVIVALVAGAFVPSLVAKLAGNALPVPPRIGLYLLPMALAAAYGLLVAFAFALTPLAHARAVSAASLFRGALDARRPPPLLVLASVAGAILLAAALAIGSAHDYAFAAGFLGAAAALLSLLALIGRGVRELARRLPRPRRPLLRLAITNLHAPSAQTDRLVVALGIGFSLFVTLAVIQTNLAGQMRSTIPAKAPTFFILDIPSADIDRFRATIAKAAPDAGPLVTVPSLRGPIVALNGVRVATMKNVPEGAWMLRGDRGLTFAQDLPRGNVITAGRWWSRDYAGPPLVSMDQDAGDLLHLKVGDSIVVSALGVEVPATIASFRKIDWQSMGFNFAMIFSPGTFDGAPFNDMATLSVPTAREAAVNRAVTADFPSVSLIRVKDVLDTVGNVLGQLAAAIAAASSVAIAAGIAVLIGAIAAARRARVYDAMLLKLLGATRCQILFVQGVEHVLLSTVVALVALAVGAGGGYFVVTRMFHLTWAPDWGVVALTLTAGVILTLGIGLLGALPALRARPAQGLRTL